MRSDHTLGRDEAEPSFSVPASFEQHDALASLQGLKADPPVWLAGGGDLAKRLRARRIPSLVITAGRGG